MASPSVDIATGITIVFSTSAFLAEILDITGPGLTRESVDVTHQGTVDARIHAPVDLFDGGEMSFDVHFNPDTDPPIDQDVETVTITWPSTAKWEFDGFMTAYEPSAPLEDKMVGSITIKVSGDITITAAI